MKMLLQPFMLSALPLKNHVVMAPMTRSRAINNLPNDLMATYYVQPSEAGLIITDGTAPSPEGLGPAIYSPEQVEGWKLVTTAVHQAGSK